MKKTMTTAARDIRTMGRWNDSIGDVAPDLLTRVANWPNDLGLRITVGGAPGGETPTHEQAFHPNGGAVTARRWIDLHLDNEEKHYWLKKANGEYLEVEPDGDCFYACVIAGLEEKDRQAILGLSNEAPDTQPVLRLRHAVADALEAIDDPVLIENLEALIVADRLERLKQPLNDVQLVTAAREWASEWGDELVEERMVVPLTHYLEVEKDLARQQAGLSHFQDELRFLAETQSPGFAGGHWPDQTVLGRTYLKALNPGDSLAQRHDVMLRCRRDFDFPQACIASAQSTGDLPVAQDVVRHLTERLSGIDDLAQREAILAPYQEAFEQRIEQLSQAIELLDRHGDAAIPLYLDRVNHNPSERDFAAPLRSFLNDETVSRIEAVTALRDEFSEQGDPVISMLKRRLGDRHPSESVDAIYDQIASGRTRRNLERDLERSGAAETGNDDWTEIGNDLRQLVQQLRPTSTPAVAPLRVPNAIAGAVGGLYALSGLGLSPDQASLRRPIEASPEAVKAEGQDDGPHFNERSDEVVRSPSGNAMRAGTQQGTDSVGAGRASTPGDTDSNAPPSHRIDPLVPGPIPPDDPAAKSPGTSNHDGSSSALLGTAALTGVLAADHIVDFGEPAVEQAVQQALLEPHIANPAIWGRLSNGARELVRQSRRLLDMVPPNAKRTALGALAGLTTYGLYKAWNSISPSPTPTPTLAPEQSDATPDAPIESLDLPENIHAFVEALEHLPAGRAYGRQTAWQVICDLVQKKGDAALDEVRDLLEQPGLEEAVDRFLEADGVSRDTAQAAEDNAPQDDALDDLGNYRQKMRGLSLSAGGALERGKRSAGEWSRIRNRSSAQSAKTALAPLGRAGLTREVDESADEQEVDQALDAQICTWAVPRDPAWSAGDADWIRTQGAQKFVLFNGRWFKANVAKTAAGQQVTINKPRSPGETERDSMMLLRKRNGWTVLAQPRSARQGSAETLWVPESPANIAAWEAMRAAHASRRQHPGQVADDFLLLERFDGRNETIHLATETFTPSITSPYGKALEKAQQTLRQLQSNATFAPHLQERRLCWPTLAGTQERTEHYVWDSLKVRSGSVSGIFEHSGYQYEKTLIRASGNGPDGTPLPDLHNALSAPGGLYDQAAAVGGVLDLAQTVPLSHALRYYGLNSSSLNGSTSVDPQVLARMSNERIETYIFGDKDDPFDIELLAGDYVDVRGMVGAYTEKYLNESTHANLAKALVPRAIPGFKDVKQVQRWPGAAFAALIDRPNVQAFTSGLLKDLGWYGGEAHESTSPRVRTALLQMALTESIAPTEQRTPFQMAGFKLEKGEFYPKIRENFETYLSGKLNLGPTQTALVAPCLLAEIAPEFRLKDIPEDLRFGSSLAWADLRHGVALQEAIRKGSSQRYSASELSSLPAQLSLNATDNQRAALAAALVEPAIILYSSPEDVASPNFNVSTVFSKLASEREIAVDAVATVLKVSSYPKRMDTIAAKIKEMGYSPYASLKHRRYDTGASVYSYGVSDTRGITGTYSLKDVIASGDDLDHWSSNWNDVTHNNLYQAQGTLKIGPDDLPSYVPMSTFSGVKPAYDKELDNFIEDQRNAYATLVKSLLLSLPQKEINIIKNSRVTLYPVMKNPESSEFVANLSQRDQSSEIARLGFVIRAEHGGKNYVYDCLPYINSIKRRPDAEKTLDEVMPGLNKLISSMYISPKTGQGYSSTQQINVMVNKINQLDFDFTKYKGTDSEYSRRGYLVISKPVSVDNANRGVDPLSRITEAAKMHFGYGGGNNLKEISYGPMKKIDQEIKDVQHEDPLRTPIETFLGAIPFVMPAYDGIKGHEGWEKALAIDVATLGLGVGLGRVAGGTAKVAASTAGKAASETARGASRLSTFSKTAKSLARDVGKELIPYYGIDDLIKGGRSLSKYAERKLAKKAHNEALSALSVDPSTWKAASSGDQLKHVNDLDNVPVRDAGIPGNPKQYLVDPKNGKPMGPRLIDEGGDLYTEGALRSRFISKNSDPMYTMNDLNVHLPCTRTKRTIQAACFPDGAIDTIARVNTPEEWYVRNGISWTAGEWRPDVTKKLVVFEGQRISTDGMTPVKGKLNLADTAPMEIVQGRFGGANSRSPFCMGKLKGAYQGIDDTFAGGALIGKHASPDGNTIDIIIIRRGPNDYFIGKSSGELAQKTQVNMHGISLKKGEAAVKKSLAKTGIDGMTYDKFYKFAQAYEGAVDFGLHCRWLDEKGIQSLVYQYEKVEQLARKHGISSSNLNDFDPFKLGSTLPEAVISNKNVRKEFNTLLANKINGKQDRKWKRIDEQDGDQVKDILNDLYHNEPRKLEVIRNTNGGDIQDMSSMGILPKNAAGVDKNFAMLKVETADGKEYVLAAISGGMQGKFPTLKTLPDGWARTSVEGVPAVRTSNNRVIIECPVDTMVGQREIDAIYNGPPNSVVPSGVGTGRYNMQKPVPGKDLDLEDLSLSVSGNFRLADTERMQAEAFDRIVKSGKIGGSPITSGLWYSTKPICDSCVLTIATVEGEFPNAARLTIIEGGARGKKDTPLFDPAPPVAQPQGVAAQTLGAGAQPRNRREISDLAFARTQHQETTAPSQKRPRLDVEFRQEAGAEAHAQQRQHFRDLAFARTQHQETKAPSRQRSHSDLVLER